MVSMNRANCLLRLFALSGFTTLFAGLSLASQSQTTTYPGAAEVNYAAVFSADDIGNALSPNEETLRRASSQLLVRNRTRYKIRLYVDGDDVGFVSPNGNASGHYSGICILRGVAYFDDGSTSTWGPQVVDFDEGNFTWTLTY